MIKQLLTSALGLSFLATNAQVVPNIDWVKYKSDRSQISNVPSAIDANNNAFITGYMFVTASNANANTVKYDQFSTELWTASYDNGGFDNSKAIVLDAAGNSYVTGESDGTGTGRDIVTIKYDPNGTQLWATRFNGATNGNDVGNSIILDPSGNVYVTGYTTNMGGNRDYVTIKYNASGVQQFAVIFAGAGNGNDEAVAVAFNNNRLYVTGTAINASGNSDLVTLRLNQNTGATVWTKSENGTANSNDVAYALLAYNNDVVVVGQIANSTTGNDYITSYYNGNNGNTVWSKQYDFANTNGGATALTVDATNRFAVTGIVNNGGIMEYHTLLYNTSGTQLWVNKVSTGLAGVNANPQIAVDPIANHFYVCGQKQGTGSDILVYQLTPSGNKSWEETFNGAQNSTDAAVDLVVNSSGVIYVAGASLNSSAKYDYTTIRISQTPVAFPIDFNNANEPATLNNLYYENTGEIVDFSLSSVNDIKFYSKNTYPQYFIKKSGLSFLIRKKDDIQSWDSTARIDLNFIKANQLSKAYSFDIQNDGYLNYFKPSFGAAGKTDVKGSKRLMIPNIYTNIDLHYYSNSDGIKMYFVVKPNANPKDIELAFSGNINSSLNSSNQLLINSTLGNFGFKAAKIYNITSAVTTMSVVGTFTNTSLNTYKFNVGSYISALPLVVELEQLKTGTSTNSACDWSTFYGGSGWENSKKILVDATGNTFLIGETDSPNFPSLTGGFLTSNGGSRDAFIVKLSPSGAPLFGTFYGGGGSSTEANGIAINSNGDILIAGTTADAALPIVPASSSTFFGGTYDGYVAKFNSTCNSLLFSRFYGTASDDYLSDAGIDASDNFYFGGNSQSNSGLPAGSGGGYVQTSGFGVNGIVGKINSANVLTWSTYFGGGGIDAINSIKVKSNGNILISGTTEAQNRASLNVSNPICGVPLNGSDFPDCTGGGAFYGQAFGGGFQDNFIAEFNSTGNMIWSTLFGSAAQDNDAYLAVNPANQNEVFLVGNTGRLSASLSTGASGSYIQSDPLPGAASRGYIAKFVNRQLVWFTLLGDGGNIGANSAVCDNNGNLYVTGYVKAAIYSTGSTCQPVIQANAQTQFPKCFPVGVFNQVSFGGSAATGDAFIVGFNGNNQMIWSSFYGGSSFDEGKALAYDQTNNKLCFTGVTQSGASIFPLLDPATGNYQQNTNAGSSTSFLNPSVNRDCFLAKFCVNFPSVGIEEKSSNKGINAMSVYPNPTSHYTEIKVGNSINGTGKYNLIDISGKIVESGEIIINDSKSTINFQNKDLINGLYLLKVSYKAELYLSKLIIE